MCYDLLERVASSLGGDEEGVVVEEEMEGEGGEASGGALTPLANQIHQLMDSAPITSSGG